MAKPTVPIEINSIDLASDVIKAFIESVEPAEGASADYTKGMKDFGAAILSMLDQLSKEANPEKAHTENNFFLNINGAHGVFPEQFIKVAIEKCIKCQPVMKPINGYAPEVASHLCCPSCGESVINYFNRTINPPHCMMCGQALDWSER